MIAPAWIAAARRLPWRMIGGGALVLAAVIGIWLYGRGQYRAGATAEAARWQVAQAAAQRQAQADIQRLEKTHAEEQGRIAARLAAVEYDRDAMADRIDAAAVERLRQSEQRADLYQRQAAAGAAAAGDLARHAAQLDRQLAEGLGVVEELTSLVGQRDSQLRLLGETIHNDRAAIEAWPE